MSRIHAYHALSVTIREESKDASDDINDELCSAAWRLEMAILKSRAQSRADINIKLGLWSRLIEDPMCILDEHAKCWRTLLADIQVLMCAAEHPERYPDFKVTAA